MIDVQLILKTFHDTSLNIVSNLHFTVVSMATSLLMIDLTLTMLFNEDDGMKIFMTLMKKILTYGFFLWLILNFEKIVLDDVLNGFIQLGNVASGNGSSTTFTLNLNNLLSHIMDLVAPTMFASTGAIGALDVMLVESIPIGMVLTLMGIVFFIVMTVLEILITFIKFYLVGAFTFLFLPFGLFKKTRDIAMKGLHAIFAMGIEIMILVTVVNLASRVITFSSITSDKLSLTELLTQFVSSIFFFFIIKRVPSICSTLLSGSIGGLGMTEGMGGVATGMIVSNSKQVASTIKDTYSAYKNASGNKEAKE